MTLTIDTTDARTAKAIELLATADRWLKITSKTDGRRYYVVPGSNGRIYWARPDATHRGLTCKHQLATALYVATVNAERQQPKRRAPKPAPTFTRDASIGGPIQTPEAARLRCLADSIWGCDGE